MRHETGLSPPVKYFTNLSKAVLLLWIIYVISFLFLLCFRACLFINALWSPAGKGLTSWLSFLVFDCEVVTFPLVSCVRCGACLLLLPLWESVIVLCIFVRYFMSILVLQSSCWGRES